MRRVYAAGVLSATTLLSCCGCCDRAALQEALAERQAANERAEVAEKALMMAQGKLGPDGKIAPPSADLLKALAFYRAAQERAEAAEKALAKLQAPPDAAAVDARRAKWEDWQYPNVAHTFYRGFQGDKTWQVVCATADDFDQVVAFYEKKLPAGNGVKQDFAIDPNQNPPVKIPRTEAFGGWQDSVRVPEAKDTQGNQPRPVKVRLFSHQVVPGGSYVIVVSRAEVEKHTHIIFLSLLPSSQL
jgi:hypothetical protein